VAAALFNLSTHYRTVFFLSDRKDIHVMGQLYPICPLKVKLGHDWLQSQPSQLAIKDSTISYSVTNTLQYHSWADHQQTAATALPNISLQPQIHTSMYNYCSVHHCRNITYPALCDPPRPHTRVPKDNPQLRTSTSWDLRSIQWHCWRFKCCGMLRCVTVVSGSWRFNDCSAFIFKGQAVQ
jgi:hypothetical protein